MNAYLEPEGCTFYCEDCAPDGADGYPDGGGEADYPVHCDECHEPLGNPLTTDGVEYVIEAIRESLSDGKANRNAIHECYEGTWYEGSRHCEIVRDWATQLRGYGLTDQYERLVDRYLGWTKA